MLLVTYYHKPCLMGSTLIPCKGKLQVGPCHCNVHSFVCMDSVAGYLNVCFGVDNCCTSFAALKCNYYHSLMRIGNNWLCLSVCIYVVILRATRPPPPPIFIITTCSRHGGCINYLILLNQSQFVTLAHANGSPHGCHLHRP